MPSCGLMSAATTRRPPPARAGRATARAGRAAGRPPRTSRPGPRRAVEPGDRVEHRRAPRRAAPPLAAAELADHRPDEVAEREVGEDRRDLDQVADAAERVADDADEPQDVQVARACSRGRSPGRRSRRPSSARLLAQKRNDARSTPKPEPGSRYAMMSRRASPRASRTRIAPTASRVPVRRGGARASGRAHRLRGQSRRDRSPASDEVVGSVAQGAARPRTRPASTPRRPSP